MKTHTKKIKHLPVNTWSGYSGEVAFDIELECYSRLQNYPNFPSLVSFNKSKKTLELEHCGTSLDILLDEVNILELIPNLDNQLTNIWTSLEKENIKHLDLRPRNFTFKDNILYLIDFDVAIIDDKIITKKIESIFKKEKTSNLGRIFPDTGKHSSLLYIHTEDDFISYFRNFPKNAYGKRDK
jgi:hypothetical protein